MTRRHSHAHYGQKIKVKKVIPHPQYNDVVAHDNDIALFQVSWLKNLLKSFLYCSLACTWQTARYTCRLPRPLTARLPATARHEGADFRNELHGDRLGQEDRQELWVGRCLFWSYFVATFLAERENILPGGALLSLWNIDRNSISV